MTKVKRNKRRSNKMNFSVIYANLDEDFDNFSTCRECEISVSIAESRLNLFGAITLATHSHSQTHIVRETKKVKKMTKTKQKGT